MTELVGRANCVLLEAVKHCTSISAGLQYRRPSCEAAWFIVVARDMQHLKLVLHTIFKAQKLLYCVVPAKPHVRWLVYSWFPGYMKKVAIKEVKQNGTSWKSKFVAHTMIGEILFGDM